MRKFKENLRLSKRNEKGLLFDEIDRDLSTKDKAVIMEKMEMLNCLMEEFFCTKNSDRQKTNGKKNNLDEILFLTETLEIDKETLEKDISLYHETLNDLEEKTIKLGSKLLDKQNRLSLLAMVVYSYKEDQDLDDWLAEYAEKNNTYFPDQKKNFRYMREAFERFLLTKL